MPVCVIKGGAEVGEEVGVSLPPAAKVTLPVGVTDAPIRNEPEGEGVAVPVGEISAAAIDVPVGLLVPESLPVGDWLGVSLPVPPADTTTEARGVAVWEGDTDGEKEASFLDQVELGVPVGDTVAVPEGELVEDRDGAVKVCEGMPLGVGEGDSEAEGVVDMVGVIEGVGEEVAVGLPCTTTKITVPVELTDGGGPLAAPLMLPVPVGEGDRVPGEEVEGVGEGVRVRVPAKEALWDTVGGGVSVPLLDALGDPAAWRVGEEEGVLVGVGVGVGERVGGSEAVLEAEKDTVLVTLGVREREGLREGVHEEVPVALMSGRDLVAEGVRERVAVRVGEGLGVDTRVP